ncbi:MAG: serine hydrolase [Patescibacteria group bacterium]
MPYLSLVKYKKILGILLIPTLFFLGFLVGKNTAPHEDSRVEIREKGYKYISPLLDYEVGSSVLQGDIISLKQKIEDYIEDQYEQADVTHISVYFRDLYNGPVFGINEKEAFTPASLLKVPILIAVFKSAEKDPGILLKKIPNIRIEDGVLQNITPANSLTEGAEYTISDLARYMIVYSNNQAKNLLITHTPNDDLDRVYKDFGMNIPGVVSINDFMTVKNYAAFFRILFNASYLNKSMSEQALELLSQTQYNKGIVVGVPQSIIVSHKFGEREENGIKQLHDCGIVYFPNKPYLVCIMTRGDDWDRLAGVIATISRMVYEGVGQKSGD